MSVFVLKGVVVNTAFVVLLFSEIPKLKVVSETLVIYTQDV